MTCISSEILFLNAIVIRAHGSIAGILDVNSKVSDAFATTLLALDEYVGGLCCVQQSLQEVVDSGCGRL